MEIEEGIDLRSLEKLIDETVIDEIKDIEFDKYYLTHFFVISLYCSILELAYSVVILVRARQGYHGYPLLRVMIEAYADLLLVMQDPKHIDNISLVHEKHWLFLLKEARQRHNPFIASLCELRNLDEIIETRSQKVDELKASGAHKLSIEAKYKLLGEENVYNGPYRMLSNYSHNNLQALISRHMRATGDGYEIAAFAPTTEEEVEVLVDSTFRIVSSLLPKVKEYFEAQKNGVVAGQE